MYGPNQIGDVIIGNAVATETTAQTFIATASDKEVAIVSQDGAAAALNTPFKFLQKTAGVAAKNLGYEFTEVIDPRYIERITVSNYAAEVQKVVTISGFTGNVLANHTYELEVRLYNPSGVLSPENFSLIHAYYVTGASIVAETAATIRDGLLLSLNRNLTRRGASEFTAVASGANITITSQFQYNDPGRDEGRMIEFDVVGKVFQNVQDLTQPQQNLGLLISTVTTPSYVGKGTAKLASNYEWFVKGYKYDPSRELGYPVNFNTPYYADAAGEYDVIDITYYTPRTSTIVERQYKTCRVFISANGLTGVAELVTVLGTITGDTLTVPGTTLIGG